MPSIPNLALRGLQLFFGILVLGLSGHLVASQSYGGAPSATNYNVFVGILILVVAVIGILADFVSVLGGIVMMTLDAASLLFTFAGGVAFAAQLGAHSCSCNLANASCPYLVNNNIINGGVNGAGQVDLNADRVGRCKQAQADTAFIWFAFACFIATFVLSFLSWRRGGLK